jgi:hypothetical protein
MPGKLDELWAEIKSKLGSSFSLNQLRCYIEMHRNKPLLIERDTMPPGMSGYVVGLKDVDLIGIAADADEVMSQSTIVHEMAHLASDHIARFALGEDTPTYEDFCHNRNGIPLKYRSIQPSLPDAHEWEAEGLCRYLLAAIHYFETKAPEYVQNMFR